MLNTIHVAAAALLLLVLFVNELRKASRVFERDVPLLINGETGCGKEAFAKAVHQTSQRGDKAFVALNRAAIPETWCRERIAKVWLSRRQFYWRP